MTNEKLTNGNDGNPSNENDLLVQQLTEYVTNELNLKTETKTTEPVKKPTPKTKKMTNKKNQTVMENLNITQFFGTTSTNDIVTMNVTMNPKKSSIVFELVKTDTNFEPIPDCVPVGTLSVELDDYKKLKSVPKRYSKMKNKIELRERFDREFENFNNTIPEMFSSMSVQIFPMMVSGSITQSDVQNMYCDDVELRKNFIYEREMLIIRVDQ
jgi:hypothetical protein